jgi:hypothetical protein
MRGRWAAAGTIRRNSWAQRASVRSTASPPLPIITHYRDCHSRRGHSAPAWRATQVLDGSRWCYRLLLPTGCSRQEARLAGLRLIGNNASFTLGDGLSPRVGGFGTTTCSLRSSCRAVRTIRRRFRQVGPTHLTKLASSPCWHVVHPSSQNLLSDRGEQCGGGNGFTCRRRIGGARSPVAAASMFSMGASSATCDSRTRRGAVSSSSRLLYRSGRSSNCLIEQI